MILIFALDYPTGAGAYSSGGWSKSAKYRPQPVVVTGQNEDLLCGAMAGGKRRRKFTAFDLSQTPPVLIRRDYALDELRKLGAKLPEIYCDELGNIRGADDKLIMQGP